MLRKQLNDLVRFNNTLYFAGKPYSGQAYAITDQGIIENVYDVEAGVVVRESTDILSLPTSDALRIHGSFLDYSDDGVALYNGEPYTGIVYSFEQTELVDESSYYNGISNLDNRQWHLSGWPKSIVSDKGAIGWYVDGSLAKHRIKKGKFPIFYLKTNAPNKLSWLTLTDEYECDLNVIKTFGLAEKLVLDGNKIDDQVLAEIEQKDDFRNVVSLDISDSVITDRQLADINLENIKELDLSDNKYISLEVLHALKKKYPHCEICVDDEYL